MSEIPQVSYIAIKDFSTQSKNGRLVFQDFVNPANQSLGEIFFDTQDGNYYVISADPKRPNVYKKSIAVYTPPQQFIQQPQQQQFPQQQQPFVSFQNPTIRKGSTPANVLSFSDLQKQQQLLTPQQQQQQFFQQQQRSYLPPVILGGKAVSASISGEPGNENLNTITRVKAAQRAEERAIEQRIEQVKKQRALVEQRLEQKRQSQIEQSKRKSSESLEVNTSSGSEAESPKKQTVYPRLGPFQVINIESSSEGEEITTTPSKTQNAPIGVPRILQGISSEGEEEGPLEFEAVELPSEGEGFSTSSDFEEPNVTMPLQQNPNQNPNVPQFSTQTFASYNPSANITLPETFQTTNLSISNPQEERREQNLTPVSSASSALQGLGLYRKPSSGPQSFEEEGFLISNIATNPNASLASKLPNFFAQNSQQYQQQKIQNQKLQNQQQQQQVQKQKQKKQSFANKTPSGTTKQKKRSNLINPETTTTAPTNPKKTPGSRKMYYPFVINDIALLGSANSGDTTGYALFKETFEDYYLQLSDTSRRAKRALEDYNTPNAEIGGIIIHEWNDLTPQEREEWRQERLSITETTMKNRLAAAQKKYEAISQQNQQ